MNNKGAIFSGYMYILLVFFLLSLATLLLVLNNTKKISNKAREGAEKIIDNDSSEIAIKLNGSTTTCLNLGQAYSEPGFSAKDNLGNNISVTVSSNLNINAIGEYTITYTAKKGGKEKVVERKVNVIKNNYSYTGSPQDFDVKCDGYYTIELWGSKHANGLGGYTKGTIKLNAKEKLYVYVGQYNSILNTTSFNGGTGNSGGYPGGGATDIRLLNKSWDNLESLKSRIMVAGGAGSGNVTHSHGGGLIGTRAGVATEGTQTSPGTSQNAAYLAASFGIGGGGCGGGGGYYGGGGATCASGGAGGSSFISGAAGVNAITNDLAITHTNNTLHYSGKYFVNTTIETGVNDGPGKAKIIYVGETYPKTNVNFNNVRYVKDCTNGNSLDANNHWKELQVIKDGINIALSIEPTASGPPYPGYPLSLATNGRIDDAQNLYAAQYPGEKCITIDLGKTYNIDEVAVWHYYQQNSATPITYNGGITQVSSDNTTWKTIMNPTGLETPNGFRTNAWN